MNTILTALMRIFFFLCLFCIAPALCAQEAEVFKPESLAPAYIPADRPGLEELTAALRAKRKTLGLNAGSGPEEKVSRALLLLPVDRSGAGVLSFEIEEGDNAGVWQCEALGRGLTSKEKKRRWKKGAIGDTDIYYAPRDMAGGATVPGVYDIRNISPEIYDIKVLGKPDPRVLKLTARPGKTPKRQKRLFSGVWSSWYPEGSSAVPVDMTWAVDSQKGTQGEKLPVFELTLRPGSPEAFNLRSRQLAADPEYYRGPYGRYGFAVHTDLWETPARLADPEYEGRPEKSDFRRRDTNGCVKLRPACLALFNEFISEQEGGKRRVQLEVYETPLLDGLPASPPPVK